MSRQTVTQKLIGLLRQAGGELVSGVIGESLKPVRPPVTA